MINQDKPNKEKIVYEMLLEIEAGKTYSETLVVNGSKWKLATTTFSRYWKQAQERYKLLLEDRKRTFVNKTTEFNNKAVETAIMTRGQKLEILEKIILGKEKIEKVFIHNGVPKKIQVEPDLTEIMKAIEIHNKMTGDNEPDKTDIYFNNIKLFELPENGRD